MAGRVGWDPRYGGSYLARGGRPMHVEGELDAAIWIMLETGLLCCCCVFLECAKRAELIPDGDMFPMLPLPPPILTPFAAASRFADSAPPTCCCCCGNTACRPGNPLSVVARCGLGAEAELLASQRAAFCCITCLWSSGRTTLCSGRFCGRCAGLVRWGWGRGGGGGAWPNVNTGCC